MKNDDLSKARGYLQESSWLLLEAIKEIWRGDKPLKAAEQKSLLQTIRGKILTARQFVDLAVGRGFISSGQYMEASCLSVNYITVLPQTGTTCALFYRPEPSTEADKEEK